MKIFLTLNCFRLSFHFSFTIFNSQSPNRINRKTKGLTQRRKDAKKTYRLLATRKTRIFDTTPPLQYLIPTTQYLIPNPRYPASKTLRTVSAIVRLRIGFMTNALIPISFAFFSETSLLCPVHRIIGISGLIFISSWASLLSKPQTDLKIP